LLCAGGRRIAFVHPKATAGINVAAYRYGATIAGGVLARWPRIKIVLTSGLPENKINGDPNAPSLRLLSKPYRRDGLGRLIREVLDA